MVHTISLCYKADDYRLTSALVESGLCALLEGSVKYFLTI
jgi:hypothetical protein